MSIVTVILNIALVILFLQELLNLKKSIPKKNVSIIVHLFGTGVTAAVAYIMVSLSFKAKIENEKMINYLNEKLKSINPCLSRGVSKKSGKGVNGIYNEDFDKNLILIEVGGQYNNIIEVSNTLEIFAKILSLYINEDSNEKT